MESIYLELYLLVIGMDSTVSGLRESVGSINGSQKQKLIDILDCVHRHGVIHGDIRRENIWLMLMELPFDWLWIRDREFFTWREDRDESIIGVYRSNRWLVMAFIDCLAPVLSGSAKMKVWIQIVDSQGASYKSSSVDKILVNDDADIADLRKAVKSLNLSICTFTVRSCLVREP